MLNLTVNLNGEQAQNLNKHLLATLFIAAWSKQLFALLFYYNRFTRVKHNISFVNCIRKSIKATTCNIILQNNVGTYVSKMS